MYCDWKCVKKSDPVCQRTCVLSPGNEVCLEETTCPKGMFLAKDEKQCIETCSKWTKEGEELQCVDKCPKWWYTSKHGLCEEEVWRKNTAIAVPVVVVVVVAVVVIVTMILLKKKHVAKEEQSEQNSGVKLNTLKAPTD